MGKSLERYRDEARDEFGEAGIEAAFPVWLIDIDGRRRLSPLDMVGVAVMAVVGWIGVVVSLVTNVALGLAAQLRGQSRKRAPHERRDVDHDVGPGRLVFRPDHIHLHEVREKNRAGGRLAELDQHSVVRIGPDRSGLRRTVIEIDGARWALRPQHEASLRTLLDARGIRVEPLD